MEQIFFELLRALGNLFLNPLIYWIIFFVLFFSYRRVNREKHLFQKQIFPLGAEIDRSFFIQFLFTIFISILFFILGVTFPLEIVIIICFTIFILSFVFGFSLLSASFSLGLTFIIFKILAYLNGQLFQSGLITEKTFSGLALLIGIFLFAEALAYRNITNEQTFPDIQPSQRGSWYGKHHIQKLSFVPFFIITTDQLNAGEQLFFTLNEASWEALHFSFVPFIIGFHHRIYGNLPEKVAAATMKLTRFLSVLTIILASISFYLPGLAFIAVIVAMLGRVFIQYRMMYQDEAKKPLFLHIENELRVLGIVPHSPATLLGFKVGDIIRKVNDEDVRTISEFDEQLARSETAPTFEIVRNDTEIVHIYNDKFILNRDSLGLLFPFIEFEETEQA